MSQHRLCSLDGAVVDITEAGLRSIMHFGPLEYTGIMLYTNEFEINLSVEYISDAFKRVVGTIYYRSGYLQRFESDFVIIV
jgi:hypothetical protein